MIYMETKEISKKKFSAKDICSIIDTCSNAGVTKFDLGGLKIEFGTVSDIVPDPNAVLPAEVQDPVVEEIELSPQDAALLKGIEETQAMIDDPVAYEEMIKNSYLETERLDA
jgi:hypothetical protein